MGATVGKKGESKSSGPSYSFTGLSNISKTVVVLRVILGIVFLVSSVTKFSDLESFAEAIRNFKLIGGILIPITQYTIPVIELILGICLLVNFQTLPASQFSVYLISFFTAMVTVKVIAGVEISCGCFGELSSDKIDEITIIRNLLLILIGVFLVSYYGSIKTASEGEGKVQYNWSEFVTALKKFSLVLVIFFFATQSALTGVQNRILKNRIIFLAESGQEYLVSGDTVSTFTILHDNSEQEAVQFPSPDSSKSLIFIMSTSCNPCKKTLPYWKKLWSELHTELNVFAIAINPYDQVKYYRIENDVAYEIYTISEDSFVTTFKDYKTPQTILLDKKGIVERSWLGQLANVQVREIISFSNN